MKIDSCLSNNTYVSIVSPESKTVYTHVHQKGTCSESVPVINSPPIDPWLFPCLLLFVYVLIIAFALEGGRRYAKD